jgi:hypothetical protein
MNQHSRFQFNPNVRILSLANLPPFRRDGEGRADFQIALYFKTLLIHHVTEEITTLILPLSIELETFLGCGTSTLLAACNQLKNLGVDYEMDGKHGHLKLHYRIHRPKPVRQEGYLRWICRR